MANSLVLYEVKEQIAYITMNRSEKGNALNPQLCGELASTWDHFEQDPEARVAILGGAGKNFCVGLDLTTGVAGEKALSLAMPANGVKVFKPIISIVQGWAVGAGYMLASKGTDITIASENANFSFPEAKVGIGGNMSFQPLFMPFKVMLEFNLTGEPINARRAYEIGLVNKVVPDAELMSEGHRMAEILKSNAPLTLRALKYAMWKTANDAASLDAMEFAMWVKPQLESEDMKEGARAFAEHRKPHFTGR